LEDGGVCTGDTPVTAVPHRSSSHAETATEKSRRLDAWVDEELLAPPVAAADPHLLDTELGHTFTDEQQKHIDSCAWCQDRSFRSSANPGFVGEDAFLAAVSDRLSSEGDDTLRRLTGLWPSLHALTKDRDARDDVRVGQLWRLRWCDTTELALALGVDRWWVTIAPVTTDTAAADEYGLLAPSEATLLGVPVAVCVSLECVVPLFTFDQLISPAALPARADGGFDGLPDPHSVRDLWHAWRRGAQPPSGFNYGEPLHDGDLDRRELRNALAAAFTPLASAGNSFPGQLRRTTSESLTEMLQALAIPPSEMASRSGLEHEVFLRVKQGGRVTAPEASKLASMLETDPETVLAANPPLDDGVVIQVSRPKWRPQLRRLAAHHQTSETEQRSRVAESVAASKLRSVHSRMYLETDSEFAEDNYSSPWESLVEMYLHAELTSLSGSATTETQPPPIGETGGDS